MLLKFIFTIKKFISSFHINLIESHSKFESSLCFKLVSGEFPNENHSNLNVLVSTQFLQKSYVFVTKQKRKCELRLKKCQRSHFYALSGGGIRASVRIRESCMSSETYIDFLACIKNLEDK